MQEKLAALKKKFDSLPPAAKVAAAAGVGLLLFMLIKMFKGSSAKTTAANQYAESDGTIIYPYAVDYTEAAGGSSGDGGGGGAADGYYATSADLAAVVDAMTAGNTMLLDRIDSAMKGSDVTAGNITPQTYADITQAGILDNTPVLSSVVPATSGSKTASDGKIYAIGGTGKSYVYNPSNGNIMVNGKTVAKGSADYNATYKAMLNDGVSIPGASASTNGGSTSGSKKTGSSGSTSSSKKTTSTSSKTTGTGSKPASDGKVYATGGSGKSYVYNHKTGNVMVNGKAVTKGSSTYNKTIAAARADGVKI